MTAAATATTAFRRLWRLVPLAPALALLALMMLAGLTEGIGILLLVPLLEFLGGSGSPHGLVGPLLTALNGLGLAPTPGGLLAAFVGLVALRSSVQYGRERLGNHLQHKVVDQLRQRCFAALLAAEWRWLAHTRRADHANLLLSDIGRVGVGLQVGLNLLANTATMTAYLLAALALSWSLTLVALASGALVFALLAGQRRHALSLGQSLTRASRAMHGNVQESLAGIKLAKILGAEGRHLQLFSDTTARLRAQQLQFAASTSLSRALFQLAGASLLAAYLYLGLSLWHTPVPVLLTLVLIFSRLIPLFMSSHQQLHQWLHALPALQEIDRLLVDCQACAEPLPPSDRPSGDIQQAIVLRNVTLTYADRQQPALDRLSLRLPARTTTAVMGPSGAGKSTLADVLMGLLTPDSGEVSVDGSPITGSARRAWRRQVAYVPQEVFLFHDSIRHNLLWGLPGASDEQLQLALQRAAADFVFQLPQGLDTVVGDSGARLSGGERQRLALARALLKQPSLLILDEATSALDTENEARIRQAIEQLHGDMTVLIIGHRLPTLEHADQVVVLDAGRVAAQGSWTQVRSQREIAE